MKLLRLRNKAETETLLSSTTYKTNYFDQCIYCHKYVESNYFEYNGEFYQPHRCSCDKAKEELKLKNDFLNKLNELKQDIDVDEINKITKEAIISEVERAYEENVEEILDSVIEN